jgi:hypothetical protein
VIVEAIGGERIVEHTEVTSCSRITCILLPHLSKNSSILPIAAPPPALPITVLIPVNAGFGSVGSCTSCPCCRPLLHNLFLYAVEECCCFGLFPFELLFMMNKLRYAVIETIMTATAASTCSQKFTHAGSTMPLIMPPAMRTTETIMVKMLRLSVPPRMSLRRREIRTRQRRATGMEITGEEDV